MSIEKTKIIRDEKTVFDLSAEITGISRLILALAIPLDDEGAGKLLEQPLQEALFAIESHLDRIADDLLEIDK